MIKSLIAFGLSRRPIILLTLFVFLGAGLFAFSKLNIEAYPNPAPVILEITAQAPGLSAEEMEKYYTIPMEIGLYTTPGISNVRSTSFYGLSFVRVTFRYGIDFFFAYSQAAVAIQQNISLPGNLVPTIQQSSLTGEIYRYEVVGPPGFGLSNLRTVQDWIVARRLATIPGIVMINSWGGTTKEFQVHVDMAKLQAYGMTLNQVLTNLGSSNINVGGREIEYGQQSINIRGVGLIDDGGEYNIVDGYHTKDIENVVLSQTNGVPIRVKDIGTVEVGFVPRLGIAGKDHNDDVVASIVAMGRNQHTNDMIPKVKEMVEKMNTDGSLPAGVKIVSYYDRSGLVGVTTHTVLENLVMGCLFVFFIQWIFLGDLRSAIIVGINIPFALLFSIIILVLRDEDANLLSIGAVDFGIIVDSAVILVENIFRNFQSTPAQRVGMLRDLSSGRLGIDPKVADGGGEGSASKPWSDRLKMIYISACQIDTSVLFSVVITVAAFIPLFTMQGVEGQIFGPMAKTYAYALTGGLLATFTITPVLCSYMLPEHIEEVETFIVRWLRERYEPLLKWSLNNGKKSVMYGILFLVVCGIAGSRLGSEFLPALEEGNLWIRAAMPMTMGLNAGTEPTRKMREILLRHPEVVTVVSQHGRPDNGSDASPFSNVELFVPLKPMDEWPKGEDKEQLIAKIQKEFNDELPGIVFNFSQYIQDNVEEALSGVKGANSVKIIGPDLKELEKYAVQVKDVMAKIKGVEDLGIFNVLGQPNLNIKINREKAARYNLNTGDVNAYIQAALSDQVATTVLEGPRQFNLSVRLDKSYRNDIDKIKELRVGYQNNNGSTSYVPLKDVADIALDTGAAFIYHESTVRYIPIKFSVRGRDLGSTVSEAQQKIAKAVPLARGYRIEWAGEFESLQKASARLMVIVPITLIVIIILLYCLFNNVRDVVFVLSGLPFAIGGGILGLWVSGLDFSISAAIGFISLFGISVMNGILMTTYFNETYKTGKMNSIDAMYHAATHRMRPMLMTAWSACIGLFPAAIATGIGSQVQKPLATVVVGGLLIGPIMLLIVVPALCLLMIKEEGELKGPSHISEDAHH